MAESTARSYNVQARSTDTFGRVFCSARHHHFVVDGPVQNGCPGEAIGPAELFLAGIGACGVELVQVIAREQQLPLATVNVEIEYLETVKYDNGQFSLRFPLTLTPRYIPGVGQGRQGSGWSADTGQVPDASMITPPVAIAAFAAAGIARADPMRTGWEACRFGWSAFIVPFLFVLSPTLLLIGPADAVALAIVTAVLGIWLVSIAIVGYFMRPLSGSLRLAFGVSGLLSLIPAGAFPGAVITDILGAAAGAVLIARELWLARARTRGREARRGTTPARAGAGGAPRPDPRTR